MMSCRWPPVWSGYQCDQTPHADQSLHGRALRGQRHAWLSER
jgi:hypothetical protein